MKDAKYREIFENWLITAYPEMYSHVKLTYRGEYCEEKVEVAFRFWLSGRLSIEEYPNV